jgi:Ca2+-binding RTX toxin-like protein
MPILTHAIPMATATAVHFNAPALPQLSPMHYAMEPATLDNPYGHTDQFAGSLDFSGGEISQTYQLGRVDNVLNNGTSTFPTTVLAGDGNDIIVTGSGADKLYGEDGHDTLMSGSGDDLLLGGAGNDILNGGAGSDDLWGGTGNDTLIGGTGSDDMWGGAGSDTFAVDFGYSFTRHLPGGQGGYDVHVPTTDTIHDFTAKDFIDQYIAGTEGNYVEATLNAGHGLDAATAYADGLFHDGVQYVFVTDGTDGYLFSDQGAGDPGVAVLEGLGSVANFDWHNII